MKILVVGKGGREHAILDTLRKSPGNPSLFACPGSDAISMMATCFDFEDMDQLMDRIQTEAFDLIVAGEESYLAKGLADKCLKLNIPIWGPKQYAAQLETSKIFAKEFMTRHNIPTGGFTVVEDAESCRAAISSYPTVLKYNGLAAGKGVAVCFNEAQAEEFIDMIFIQEKFGKDKVFVEEFLEGKEVSIICAITEDKYQLFTPARDYKRLGENDEGPNTGGMGAVATADLISPELLAEIEETCVKPTVAGLVKDELDYKGFLYFGVILTEDGPKLLEFNCRFGDPEAQAVLSMIEGDFANFLLKGTQGELDSSLLNIYAGWSICLVMASAGYPASSRSGDVISGLELMEHSKVFHAGTKRNAEGRYETNGGRVLAVVAKGETRDQALASAMADRKKITFDGAQFRNDIAIMHFEEPVT